MNGRYFAGKQITCEFVAVTRWKAAICGEYMRSRYKTCSHGVACNFIHCFRNPGGDYEWADWDNPPPRYWVRKMAALFGPAADTAHDKASDIERPHRSDRRREKNSSDRYVSRRSMDGDMHTEHSSRDYSHSKKEHSSHSMTYEYSWHRRGSSAADRHQWQDIEDTNGRQSSTTENQSQPHKHRHGERRRSDHGDGGKYDDKIRSRKHRSDLQPGSSDWPSDLTDTDVSKGSSRGKSRSRYDDHRKSSRKSSEDHNLKRHYTEHKSAQKEHSTRRGSKCGTEDDYYDEKNGRRGKSENRKDGHNSSDRWVATNSDVDSDDDRYQRSSGEGTKFGRKGDAHSDVEARHHQRSSSRTRDDKRKRKCHSRDKQHSTTEEDTTDSDTRDLSSDSWSCRSRSSEENFSAHRSKRKRSRSKEKSSS